MASNDGRDHDGRHLGQVFGEVLCRRHVFLLWVAGAFEAFGGAGHPLPCACHVQVGQRLLHSRFADHQPASARQVSTGRGLFGHVDAVENDLVVDASLEVEPPTHRSRRGEGVINSSDIDVHPPKLLFWKIRQQPNATCEHDGAGQQLISRQ